MSEKNTGSKKNVRALIDLDDYNTIKEHFPMHGATNHIIRVLMSGLAKNLRSGKIVANPQEELFKQSKRIANV